MELYYLNSLFTGHDSALGLSREFPDDIPREFPYDIPCEFPDGKTGQT
jgi:hypothetical protein